MIYYWSLGKDGIFKTKIDGTSNSQLNNLKISSPQVLGGWIYYSNRSAANSIKYPGYGFLFKTSIDGTETIQLNSDLVNDINVVGEWIYYTNRQDNSALYKIKID